MTLLLSAFDQLVDADGGLVALRASVRLLAVTGRLVPSSGDTESATALLTRLGGSPAKMDGLPAHELPATWSRARFSDVAEIASNLVPPSQFPNAPHVAPDNIEKGTGRLLPYRTVREDGVTSGKHRFFAGQILYSKIRPNLSKVVIVDFDGLCSADMYPLNSRIDTSYLHLFLLSPLFLEQVVRADNRLAMPKVNQEQLSATFVALPPPTEQKRIVAKVDELMRLMDDLEAKQTKKRDVQTRFRSSALDALTKAEGPEDLATAWGRVAQNFEDLLPSLDDLDAFRLALMDAALRGFLVRKTRGEETAADLLSKIAARREQAFKSGSYRRPKPLPPLASTDCPFSVPPTWKWVRLGDLCFHVADGPHFSPQYVAPEIGIPFLSARNVTRAGVDISTAKYVSQADHETFCKRVRPEKGDILYVKGGVNGGTAAVNRLDLEFSVWVHLAVLKLVTEHVYPEYVAMALNSPFCYRQSKTQTHGIGNLDIGLTRLVLISLPLPPLAEQKRIVAKVEALLALCDDLEAKLKAKESTAAKLVDSIVRTLSA